MVDLKLKMLEGHANEGRVGKIHKNIGDNISAGEILMEIEADKGNTTIKSTATGKILKLEVEEGSVVKIGQTLARIEGVESKSDSAAKPNLNYFASLLKPQKKELTTDITVIGGGPGGYVAAIQAAKLGANVVLIEKDSLGGTCLNVGCIPTKCLVKSADVFNKLKEAAIYGLHAENVSVDINKVIERKNNIVGKLIGGIKYLMQKHNIKVISGEGKITDKETVRVVEGNVENTIKTKNIIIATGSEVVKPSLPGIDSNKVITSNEALSMRELPKKIVIVGGGIIGMEFAFIYKAFGVDVTVVEFLDEILGVLDEDISQEITKHAISAGIKIFTGSKVTEIIESEDNEAIVVVEGHNGKKCICANKVLKPVGRKPYHKGLGLEYLDIEFVQGTNALKINDKLQTNIPNIYAIGDVTNKIQLAHVASHQGIVAVKNILGQDTIMDYDIVPSAIFTNPEIAVVGLSEKEAKEKGIDIVVGKFPFDANGKALTINSGVGFIKLIKETATDKIVGGAIIGPNATDLIAEITLAIKSGLKAEDIIDTIHAHPTTAEAVHEAALSLEGGAIHF